MTALFEAKATINQQAVFYNIFRLQPEVYKAEILLEDGSNNYSEKPPSEIVLSKVNGKWQSQSNTNSEITDWLGNEIDVFNYGYGDLLGKEL